MLIAKTGGCTFPLSLFSKPWLNHSLFLALTMSNLKQGTLSFASSKRTNSIRNGKKTSATEKGKNQRVEIPVKSQDDEKLSEALEISSDEEGTAAVEIIVPAKRTRASTKKRSSPGIAKRAPQLSQSEKQKPSPAVIEREHLDVEDKAGRYRSYYNEVRSKMGYIQPGKYA